MFEHSPERMFQLLLLFLMFIIYAARLGRVLKFTERMKPGTISFWIMSIWSLSLLAYATGLVGPRFHLHLSVPVRWIGALCMAGSFPPAWVWVYDSIGIFFSSRANVGSIDIFSDFGSHRLSLNPMFFTFCLCAMGAILLSANSVVLVTTLITVMAMAVSMKKEFRVPA